jgi:Reverse transcriptase (RNA-dependent DNA polymerase)
VWNQYLVKGLLSLGFVQSKHNMCLFWRKSCVLVIYTDDTIITGPVRKDVDEAIVLISTRFKITTNNSVEVFLGINIACCDEQSLKLSQPHLITSIIQDLGLHPESKTKPTPLVKGQILHAHQSSPDHHEEWNYRSVIGKLNYLEKCSRLDISFAVHQCVRFSQCPKVEHTAAVKRIGRYLLAMENEGIICTPDEELLTCYADASFVSEWVKEIAEEESDMAKSRSGYIIQYAGCPIVWISKLQMEHAFSTTEAEYVSLSQGLREVIPMLEILKELKDASFKYNTAIPTVHCKALEDNTGAVEMARSPKMRPRTKHMNIKYHHFCDAIIGGLITIHHVTTTLQLAGI